MTVCRDGSRPARTVRTETVLPAPTSPVTTPMERSLMHQEMRATASLWEVCRCSMPGARSRPNGMRLNPYSLNLINSMAGGQGPLGGLPGRWWSDVDGGAVVGASVDLGELVFCAGEADLESLDLTGPAFSLGFGDAGDEVVADLDEALPLGGIGPEHWASDARMFVDARGAEGSAACTSGYLAAFEVAEELGPFLVGGVAVFLGGSQGPPAGEERQVRLDGFFGVDGLVAEGDVDVAVSGDDLGDVGWKAVED